ncbi:hypothetical protein FTO70_17005 [Methanosarcina sp. KYL-1]|uniref:hypothetical protein n=1 Tax=Methanosarcina sp. KYL-1 TaxID=2602068 RepID=UPI002100B1F7|nr:hypothetical protein [Methanosarcina sp. KYL-1]MCQ1537337.1 hypothetical protein [Methanosarcina sp. KYL-1]
MNDRKLYRLFAFSLVASSVILYFIEYLLMGDTGSIFSMFVGNLAFLPINVLLVTLVIHKLLNDMEKSNRIEKLNMVIGTFFSQTGTRLLAFFSEADPGIEEIRKYLIVRKDWSEKEFSDVSRRLKNYDYAIRAGALDLPGLRDFLEQRNDSLLRLLENPVMLEHETFTELLRAAFHLTEELLNRKDLDELPPSDLEHLEGDVRRVYSLLVYEWVAYMEYLKDNYPYLFSLSMRTNPFDREASPVVK